MSQLDSPKIIKRSYSYTVIVAFWIHILKAPWYKRPNPEPHLTENVTRNVSAKFRSLGGGPKNDRSGEETPFRLG